MTKPMTTGTTTSVSTDNKNTEVVRQQFRINYQEERILQSRNTPQTITLGRVAMKSLERYQISESLYINRNQKMVLSFETLWKQKQY